MRTPKKKSPPFNPHVVRAHFVLRGTSCKRWALGNGFKYRHVHQIIHGIRQGGKNGTRIITALKAELKKAS